MESPHYFIVPGLGGSGQNHWQSYFERELQNCIRIVQDEWDSPNCEDWLVRIDEVLKSYDYGRVILIGHSLGCATICNWAAKTNSVIRGAFLVAPSDIDDPIYDFPASGFSPMPKSKLNFPSIIVTSDDDKWVSIERAQEFSQNWSSQLLIIKNSGHINTDSGFGDWPEGLKLLERL